LRNFRIEALVALVRHASPLRLGVAAATPLALAGCATPLSALDPAGPRADALATLWWVMCIGALALFVLTMLVFAIAFYRPGALSRFSGRAITIAGGLMLPLPVLIGLTGTALVLGEQALPRADGDVPLFRAEGRQWIWRFGYPDTDVVTTDELHVPAGQPFDVELTAADVIHSFWVPRLGGKLDAIPGHRNLLRLQADEPGTYWGTCAEYCGTGHDGMHFRVIAHAAEDYANALEGLE
jgi:cytochrome c oxidase subunit 2